MSIRFSAALDSARQWVKTHAELLPENLALVRDLYGRIRIALPPATTADGLGDALWQELHAQLGPYSPGTENLKLSGDTLLAPDAIFQSQDLVPLDPSLLTGPFLLDRLITGGDWLRPQFPDAPPRVPRVTFYGLKGGVGRSTALALFARHLAGRGKNVLVLDLDLESPGVGSLLLPSDAFPPSGLVDWFVEDAVGAADAGLLDELTAVSPLAAAAQGQIRVAPAHGMGEMEYLPKLARVTLDVRGKSGMESFSMRLHRLVETLEQHWKPDVVLLDSRAGLHDVAAVSLTRLGALALLFSANGEQTWQGYRLLFRHWQAHFGVLPHFRENLRVVDALVPETGRPEHRASALAAAHALFEETIYEESAPGVQDAFNFALDDQDAPHHSIPIFWSRVFQGFNPSAAPAAVSDAEVAAAYGEFLQTCERLLLSSESTP